jgi:hypothetical protein
MEYTQIRVSKETRKEIRLLSLSLGIDIPTTIALLLSQYKSKK